MLPAYIQYGVGNPESVVAALMGVPRAAAPSIAAIYVEKNGPLKPETGNDFRSFLENRTPDTWSAALDKTKLAGRVSAEDFRQVWRDSQGLR